MAAPVPGKARATRRKAVSARQPDPLGPQLPDGMRRTLVSLRARGEAVPVSEVAHRLFALEVEPSAEVARRLVGGVLGLEADAVPTALGPVELRPAAESAVAAASLGEAHFAVVDLETTGLSAEYDAIIEIGALRVVDFEVRDTFETLLRPPGPGPLSNAIVSLTGIDDGMLCDAPRAHEALAAFRDWLGQSPTLSWVAHNARFDSSFLRRAFAGQRAPAPDAAVLCTQKLSRRLLPKLGRYNLDTLCAHFGIRNRARHRALGDAEATARAWIELLHEAGAQGHATVGDLLDLQERPTRGRRRKR